MNLDSLQSVRDGAETFLKKSRKLNVLVNNAGIRPEGRTVDGFEVQFGTGHLGHFLLFHLLAEALLKSSTQDFNSRVLNVTSSSHRRGPIHLDNLNLEGIYMPRLGYAQNGKHLDGQPDRKTIWQPRSTCVLHQFRCDQEQSLET